MKNSRKYLLFYLGMSLIFIMTQKTCYGATDIESLRREKNDLVNADKYDKAIEVVQKIMHDFPNSDDAKVGKKDIAYFYYRKREYDKALSIYKELTQNPVYGGAHIDAFLWVVSILQDNLQKYQDAIDECKSFVKNYPDDRGIQEAYYLLCSSYEYARQYDNAIPACQNFIKNYPESPQVKDVLNELVRAYEFREDYEKVIATNLLIIEKYPTEARWALINTQDAFDKLKQYDKAIETYQGLIRKTEDASLKHLLKNQIAIAYRRADKLDEAIRWWNDYLSEPMSQREWAMAMRQLADTYIKDKNYSKGTQSFKEIINKCPGTEDAAVAYLKLADTYSSRLHDDQSALDAYDNMIRSFPENCFLIPEAMFNKARIYTVQKNFDKAIVTYQEIVKNYPDYAKAAKVSIRIINEYLKNNKTPSNEERKKIYEEEMAGK